MIKEKVVQFPKRATADAVLPRPKLRFNTLTLHQDESNEELLQHYLEAEGLDKDARGLWIGYPNLKKASHNLISWIGVQWPDIDNVEVPAAFVAVKRAIHEVKNGLTRDEADKRLVIANFYTGLASITQSIAGYQLVGQTELSNLSWTYFEKKTDAWFKAEKIIGYDFLRIAGDQSNNTDGLKWKIRSSIASLGDMNIIHRFGGH